MATDSFVPTELGTEKIGKLLRKYAVPGIIAQTAASLYNMVDSIYIGHIPEVGSYAISGLAVTFPLMNLSVALGTLVGVGGLTMISVLLGQKNYKDASKVLSNVFSLNIIIGLLFMTLSLAFLDPILTFFGASENTLPFARDYMVIILLGNVVTHLYFGLNGVIRASGNPRTAMRLTLFTVCSNAALDPLFIFAFGLGVRGAAIATVLCQILALVYALRFFINKDRVPHFTKPIFQINWKIAKQSLAIGLGPFLMNAASCLVAMFINQQLGRYGGDLAIGAYGIGNRITFMFVMVVLGMTQGMQPIVGYNYGARLYKRVREVFVITVKYALLTTTLCFAVSEFIPGLASSMFTSDPELRQISVHGLRMMNSGIALVGFGMVTTTLFQSIGMIKTSVFLSLSRQLIFLIPLLYLLPLWMGVDGVWWSFPISDIVSVIASAFFVFRLFRKFSKLKDGDDSSVLGGQI